MFISGFVLTSGSSDSLRSVLSDDIFGEDLMFISGSVLTSGTSESYLLRSISGGDIFGEVWWFCGWSCHVSPILLKVTQIYYQIHP